MVYIRPLTLTIVCYPDSMLVWLSITQQSNIAC